MFGWSELSVRLVGVKSWADDREVPRLGVPFPSDPGSCPIPMIRGLRGLLIEVVPSNQYQVPPGLSLVPYRVPLSPPCSFDRR